MLKNTLDTVNTADCPLEFNNIVGRVDIDDKRILPYSIVFDLLDVFEDDELKTTIHKELTNFLSQKNGYENEIDLWVDLETAGETTVLVAKKFAELFVGYIKNKNISIRLIVNLKAKMTRDNQLFIHYLQELTNRVLISYSDVSNDASIDLSTDGEKYLSWISSGEIFNYAWSCAEIGAEEIGFRILEQKYATSTEPYLRDLYLVQLQFMRVASQYYLDAANEQRGISDDFQDLVRLMNLTKAWGSVLSRQLEKAEHYFSLAEVNIDYHPKDIDDLYRMNIYALLQHLKGQTGDAFNIELRIKDAIAQLQKTRPQITYINSINLARLYRYVGHFQEAKNHYDLAFSMIRGAKSETDYIYEKVCYGMLYEKSENYQVALTYWLKAAIYWLIAKTPEALGWRAVRAIAQPAFKPRSYLNLEVINEAFVSKLTSLAEKNKLAYTSSSGRSSNFIIFEHMTDLANTMLYRKEDLCIFLRKSKKSSINQNEDNKAILNGVVSSLLMSLLKIDDSGTNTFIIDKNKL